MERPFAAIRAFALALCFAIAGFCSTSTHATNVQFVGTVGYTILGSTVVLTANQVQNFAVGGTSGTLHMELWAFPTPYNGTGQNGYKLAQYNLGQLQGGFVFNGISGTVAFLFPPNGSWAVAMILTEFDNGPVNGGYSVRDWADFANPLVVGAPPPPGQLSFTSSLNFGNQLVGTTSAPQTIIVTNIGGTTVTVSSVGLTNTLDYVGTHTCSTLAPGASCTGTVTFHPHATGSLPGSVIVTSDGLGSPQFTQLSGFGLAATPPGQLSMASALTFANQTVGTTSAPQSVNISNIGGQAVAISSLTLNGADFSGNSSGCGVVSPGSFCTLTVTFTPLTTGNKFGSISIVSSGVGSPQSIQLTGLGVAAAPPPPTTAVAIEYHHAAFDHYFVTAIADEIIKLDNGTFVGWARTGQTFKVYPNSLAGLAGVCRFFSTSFAPKSSHFYTPDSSECAVVLANPNWQFEAVVFYMAYADVSGNCPAGTQPVYRLYNNGQGAAPNHRYTTSLNIRSQMLAQGWIPEGYGSIGVIMCAPL